MAAGFFGISWLLLGTGFAVLEVLYGDITVSPPGGPLVFVSVFYAISLYALSDFAVGRVAPALVGATRVATWAFMWGVVAFYVASHAVAGEIFALVFMVVPMVAVVALMLLVRRILIGRRRPGGDPLRYPVLLPRPRRPRFLGKGGGADDSVGFTPNTKNILWSIGWRNIDPLGSCHCRLVGWGV